MMDFPLEIEYLRHNATKIHFFGLGFIQVKLGDRSRVHVYSEDLPAFVEDPHDHRYDFISTVVKGRLISTVWDVEDGDTDTMSFETCVQGSKVDLPSRLVRATPFGTFETFGGSSYHLSADVFHTVKATFEGGPTVTVLQRSKPRKEVARVIQLGHQRSLCPFSREVAQEDLWGIVEKALEGL